MYSRLLTRICGDLTSFNKHPTDSAAISWPESAYTHTHTPTFWRAILTSKVGQTDMVFCDQGSLVGVCT